MSLQRTVQHAIELFLYKADAKKEKVIKGQRTKIPTAQRGQEKVLSGVYLLSQLCLYHTLHLCFMAFSLVKAASFFTCYVTLRLPQHQ